MQRAGYGQRGGNHFKNLTLPLGFEEDVISVL